jgi:hypothetical protein
MSYVPGPSQNLYNINCIPSIELNAMNAKTAFLGI